MIKTKIFQTFLGQGQGHHFRVRKRGIFRNHQIHTHRKNLSGLPVKDHRPERPASPIFHIKPRKLHGDTHPFFGGCKHTIPRGLRVISNPFRKPKFFSRNHPANFGKGLTRFRTGAEKGRPDAAILGKLADLVTTVVEKIPSVDHPKFPVCLFEPGKVKSFVLAPFRHEKNDVRLSQLAKIRLKYHASGLNEFLREISPLEIVLLFAVHRFPPGNQKGLMLLISLLKFFPVPEDLVKSIQKMIQDNFPRRDIRQGKDRIVKAYLRRAPDK
ncbi:MAG: hypothetical protein BWY44_01004 [Candidatus Omnitrophica bacterium ADurb.Bin292]|nr:MAG: hypothetical protein BWY44_01004 [Candidatus Omnitrophica bacterium ADurb.Bin292]